MEIYVGGAAGAHVRKGDLLCTVDTHEEVMRMSARFVQYYRENAKYLERTYGFVERMGIEKIRQIVVADSEKIAARLDAAIQASFDAYVDPWKEAYDPKTPNQFTTTLAVVSENGMISKDALAASMAGAAGAVSGSADRRVTA